MVVIRGRDLPELRAGVGEVNVSGPRDTELAWLLRQLCLEADAAAELLPSGECTIRRTDALARTFEVAARALRARSQGVSDPPDQPSAGINGHLISEPWPTHLRGFGPNSI